MMAGSSGMARAGTDLGGMTRMAATLRAIAGELGGLLLFWTVLRVWGLKPAIAVTVLFVVIDGTRRVVRRLPVTRIWMLSSGLALVGGAIDLSAATPFMIRYEAVATNLLTAGVFLAGAWGRRSVVQEVAESWNGGPFGADRHELRTFFRVLTLVWAGHFAAKALVYLALVVTMPLEQALALRSVIGTASLVLMIVLSRQGPALFRSRVAGSGAAREGQGSALDPLKAEP